MDSSNDDIIERNINHTDQHLCQTTEAISDCKSLGISHGEETKHCKRTRKKNTQKSLASSQNTLSTADFKGTKTHYKWRKCITTKTKDLKSDTSLYKDSILPVDTTGPPINLGNKVGCENSLHAVQSEAPEKPESIKKEAHEEIPDIIEDHKPVRTNSLLERLQDSKSNRMLQSINPTHNLDTSPRFEIVNSETDALSAPTKANGTSIRRSSRSVFPGQMEVLQETDSEDEKDSVEGKNRVKRKSISVKKSGSVESDSHTNIADDQERPSRLHSGADSSLIKKSDGEEVLDLTDKWCNGDIASLDQQNQAKESPRYLTAVCHNHNSQKSAEKLEAVLYCRICGQAVCYKCAFERHKDHDVTPLGSAAEMIRAKMSEQKRAIENSISQMRGKRKLMENTSEEVRKRIKAQFEEVMERLRKKEEEVIKSLEKAKQERLGSLYRMQTQQETAWGQIDAVIKTTDGIKMLEEFSSLNMMDLECGTPGSFLSSVTVNSRVTVNLNPVQEEIEKIILRSDDDSGSAVAASVDVSYGEIPRKCSKKLSFKLDPTTVAAALRISSNHTTVEYVGSARNGFVQHQPQIHPQTQATSVSQSYPYSGTGANGYLRNKRTQFSTVLGDTSITQGKQYWEVSVNRSMEYRLGVAYKHIQGTKTLADDHNSWVMCLTYPDRFAAMHKGRKEYIFRANHPSSSTAKVMRIGLYLDFERGILSFYNASNSAEKRHLYTFRTFFNRPVWPLISLRQGKLQILTGLPVPRNLVWKSR